MTRKLYLHIGFDKTGTTSLQRFMSKHVHDIPGAIFPYLDGSFSPERKVEFSHHLIAEAFLTTTREKKVINNSRLKILQREQPDLTMNDVLAGIRAQLDQDDDRPAVISSETFCRNTIDHKKLFEFVKDYDYEVVAVLRRQDGYAKSKYSQKIKHTARLKKNIKVPKFQRFIKAPWLDYYPRLMLWVDAGFEPSRIKILPFEKHLMPNGIIPYFFDSIGVDLGDIPVDSFRTNKSLGDFEILALQWYLNRPVFTDLEKRTMTQMALKYSSDFKGLPEAHFINDDIRAGLIEEFSESNQKIVDTFMPGHEGTLFPTTLPKKSSDLVEPDVQAKRKYIKMLRNLARKEGLLDPVK